MHSRLISFYKSLATKTIMQRIELFISIFIFGLIIHFIWITFLQFVVWIKAPFITLISLWKEIVILLLMGLIIWINVKRYGVAWWLDRITNDIYFKRLCIGVWWLIVITLISSLINGSFGGHYIVAARYNFIPFIVLIIWYQVAQFISHWWIKWITHTYILLIRWVIGLSIIRYFILSTLPGALKIVGYDRHVYEGKIGERPPAVYYAALDHGAPRNQFIWERPIYFGFYLIAFWPLFFLLYVRKAPKTEAIFYGSLYMIAVFTTFSRSAWWVWLILTVIMGLLIYGRSSLKYLNYLLIPILIWWALVGRYFYYELFGPGRNFSNTWHINAFFKARELLQSHWLWWVWAWSAGPASHQLGIGFNPENQYLQIWLEYGIFWLIIWLILVGFLTISGGMKRWWNHITSYWANTYIDKRDNHRLVLLSCNLGLFGLALCGLVLHSWADKMVIRPLMMIYGLWLGTKKDKEPGGNK